MLAGGLPAGLEERRARVERAPIRVDGLDVLPVDVDLGLAARRARRAVPRDLLASEVEARARSALGRVGDAIASVAPVVGARPPPGVVDRAGSFIGRPAS